MRKLHFFPLILLMVLTLPAVSYATAIGVDWFGQSWQLDLTTGQAELLGRTGFRQLNSLALLDGQLLTSDRDGNLIEIHPMTGFGTSVATIVLDGTDIDIRAMAASPTGLLFAAQAGIQAGRPVSPGLWVINPTSGEGSFVGSIREAPQAMVFHPDGTLFGWDRLLGLVTLDIDSAEVTAIGGVVRDQLIQSLLFTPGGSLLGISQTRGTPPEFLYEIDVNTGTSTVIAQVSPDTDIRGFALVPEPSTATLVLVGLISLARGRRRV